MCSFLIIISFLYNFRPVQDYFSSHETDKSVTRGGGGENPEKTTWHTHKQNLVCVTCDCKTGQLGSNLRRSVHCLGDGCCQSDIAFSITPLTSRNQLVLTACVRPFKPGTAGLIPGSISLSDDTIN